MSLTKTLPVNGTKVIPHNHPTHTRPKYWSARSSPSFRVICFDNLVNSPMYKQIAPGDAPAYREFLNYLNTREQLT